MMLVKRSFSLSGHRTSVALEPAFWTVLTAMARDTGQSLGALVAGIDASRAADDPLASSLRVAALMHGCRETESGLARETGIIKTHVTGVRGD